MNNRGFSLIEILVVILILGLLAVIAVPAAQGIGKRINAKMLQTKLDTGVNSAAMWGQENLHCFTGTSCNIREIECPGIQENFACYVITFEEIAKAGFMEFDIEDGNNKIIENPQNKKESLNNREVVLVYHTINQNLTSQIAVGSEVTISTTTTTTTITTRTTMPPTPPPFCSNGYICPMCGYCITNPWQPCWDGLPHYYDYIN